MATVKPIPEGYHSVTPYLVVRGAARAIDFYNRVFGATEIMRMPGPGGLIAHAELKIGNSTVMLADESPAIGSKAPQSTDGMGSGLYVYIENVDDVFKRATDAGAKVVQPVKDQFYGDRSGRFIDPFGHAWSVATHVEDVAPEEMSKPAAAAMGRTAGG